MPRITKADLEEKIRYLESERERILNDYIEESNRNVQLEGEIDRLKTEISKKSVEIIDLKAKDYSKQSLIEANKDLKRELEEKNKKILELLGKTSEEPHNARGAGRKSKLTTAQKEQVIMEYAGGKSVAELAEQQEVSVWTIRRIIKEQN